MPGEVATSAHQIPTRGSCPATLLWAVASGICSALVAFFIAGRVYGADRQRLAAVESGIARLEERFADHLRVNEAAIREFAAAQESVENLKESQRSLRDEVGALRTHMERRFDTVQQMLERRGYGREGSW